MLVACGSSGGGTGMTGTPPPPPETVSARTFRMGFSANPPRNSQSDLLAALDLWTSRADISIINIDVPYGVMLAGITAAHLVDSTIVPLAGYFRARHLEVIVSLNVANGLNRAAEAPDLVALGRSITESAIQQLYRDYVSAIDSEIRPDYLLLVTESNLIRDLAPDSVYQAVVTMANAAATGVAQLPGPQPLIGVSVQVDEAWGRLLHNDVYQGVEQDFHDFPFMTVLGMSSYPYFTFSDPGQIPLDYYARIRNGRTIPELVSEGGWSSVAVNGTSTSQALQAGYLRRQEQLLDSAGAVAVVQLDFTDIDIPSLNLPPNSGLDAFAHLGLVDENLQPKLALATWDSIFARPLK
jgi:hypothetical protein